MSKTDEQRAERWKRRRPISGMPIEEMQKRVADGIKNRQQSGEMLPSGLPTLKTQMNGPALTKKQRRTLIAASNLAIYSLANNEREDYCGAADVMRRTCRQAGYGGHLWAELLKGCAEQAAELAGEDFQMIDQLARAWLVEYFTPSGKLISITKGDQHGNSQEDPQTQPGPAPGERHEP